MRKQWEINKIVQQSTFLHYTWFRKRGCVSAAVYYLIAWFSKMNFSYIFLRSLSSLSRFETLANETSKIAVDRGLKVFFKFRLIENFPFFFCYANHQAKRQNLVLIDEPTEWTVLIAFVWNEPNWKLKAELATCPRSWASREFIYHAKNKWEKKIRSEKLKPHNKRQQSK